MQMVRIYSSLTRVLAQQSTKLPRQVYDPWNLLTNITQIFVVSDFTSHVCPYFLSVWRTCHSLFLTKPTSPSQSHMATLTSSEAHLPLKHKPSPLPLKWLTENTCVSTYIPWSSECVGMRAFSEDRGQGLHQGWGKQHEPPTPTEG